jgi:hypothetical protein
MKYTSYLLVFEDGAECSEAFAFKLLTPVNHPEKSIQRPLPLSQEFTTCPYFEPE